MEIVTAASKQANHGVQYALLVHFSGASLVCHGRTMQGLKETSTCFVSKKSIPQRLRGTPSVP